MTLKDVYPLNFIKAIKRENQGSGNLFEVDMRSKKKFGWKLHASFDNNMIKAVRNDVETFMTQQKLKGF